MRLAARLYYPDLAGFGQGESRPILVALGTFDPPNFRALEAAAARLYAVDATKPE